MQSLSSQQRLFLVESAQVYEAWEAAVRQGAQYQRGMRWSTSKGREYLVRLTGNRGYGRSLGVRSAETERIYAEFTEGRQRSRERVAGLSARLKEQAKLNKAIGLGRLPVVIADILGALNINGAGADFRVIGTHAIFGYEAMAGVHCKMELLASGDVDLLYDPRKQLALVSKKLDGQGLLGLLRRVDKSFEPMAESSFRAVNKEGFMVDLVGPELDMRKGAEGFAPQDLTMVEVPSLEWLASSPRIEVVAIAVNGLPVKMSVCDPRAFALHKVWLSERADREPVKKVRDREQGVLVAELVLNYLPQYPFEAEQLRYLPAELIRHSMENIEKDAGIRLPGLDF